jgi:low affinity Fe/Cu permease
MVALLQNTQTRADGAIQDKLNAIADGLVDLMNAVGQDDPKLRHDMMELRAAVGLEDRESA